MTAGIETLTRLRARGFYENLDQRAAELAKGLGTAAKKAGVPLTQTRVGSMLGAFFTKGPVVDYASAKQSNTQAYAKFFHNMLNKGVYFAPSQFEAAFLSTAHTSKDIEHTITSSQAAFKNL